MKRIRKQSVLILLLGLISIFYFSSNSLVYAEENKGLALAQELQNFFVGLAKKVQPTVVVIEPTQKEKAVPETPPNEPDKPLDPNQGGTGSGVIITADGYIVSNYHVVGENNEMKIILNDKREFTAKIVGRDPDTDLSLLKIDSATELLFSTLGNSDNVRVGQLVMAVGEPFGLSWTTTFGIVSGLNRNNTGIAKFEDFIQTDAAINPGNSGGPLFNIQGEVIGINTAIINFSNTTGFAIPANLTKEIIQQLKVSGRVIRGWLGLQIQDLNPKLAEKFNWTGKGVIITDAITGQPADKAGLKSGDIILKVEDILIETPNQLARIIAGFKPGKTIQIEIAREGIIMNFPVILADRESAN